MSGGVDSAVAAALVHKAIGDQLACVFVDTGLLRRNEAEQVEDTFRRQFAIDLVHVKAGDRFLGALDDVIDPERKRKIIGELFIRVFEEAARDLGDARFLVQGTLYPDVVESGGTDNANIKSHHNVGGLPDDMDFELVEPLRHLFKDEVRASAKSSGCPRRSCGANRSPGPGLAVRIIGTITPERVEILQQADAVVVEEIKRGLVPRDLAELRGAPGGEDRRRDGRRPHVRLSDRAARRDLRRRDDGRLGADPLRRARADLEPDYQRGPGRE